MQKTFKTVAFVSQQSMENHVKPCLNTAVISITTPGDKQARLKDGFHQVIRLQFDDLYEELIRDHVGYVPDITPTGPVLWHNLTMPDITHAQAIVQFLEGLNCDHIIVHCHAGISRSAGVAQFIVDHYGAKIDQSNDDTSLLNQRILRLLNKVYSNEEIKCAEYIPLGNAPINEKETYSTANMFGVF
jgi:predicted protein tyrosine phosphatase